MLSFDSLMLTLSLTGASSFVFADVMMYFGMLIHGATFGTIVMKQTIAIATTSKTRYSP